MGFAPVFNIPLISDIFFLIFALKKDCNKIFILLQPLLSYILDKNVDSNYTFSSELAGGN